MEYDVSLSGSTVLELIFQLPLLEMNRMLVLYSLPEITVKEPDTM